jgi:3-oxoacyl-[acyl-carrier protein] reductase
VDLGVTGRVALVCASSDGLGKACARALAAEGVDVFINGRNADRLAAAATEIGSVSARRVRGVVADVGTRDGVEALLAACPRPDILVTNGSGPAPGAFDAYGADEWMSALSRTMVWPLQLIRSVMPSMRSARFGRIVNITSAAVLTPPPFLALSSGPRAGFMAVVKGISRDVAADNVTINNLLPRRIDTQRQRFMAERVADSEDISFEEARTRQAEDVAAGRLGRPEEFGAACAFLCSELAGFISGQSISVDGGSQPGV